MARITAAKLDRYRELETEATELAGRAATLRREAKTILDEAEADLIATGKTEAKRGGYLLRWKMGRASIAWKNEFVRVAGAEAADQLSKAAPEKKSLEVIAPTAA
jgi:hypothetical protein